MKLLPSRRGKAAFPFFPRLAERVFPYLLHTDNLGIFFAIYTRVAFETALLPEIPILD